MVNGYRGPMPDSIYVYLRRYSQTSINLTGTVSQEECGFYHGCVTLGLNIEPSTGFAVLRSLGKSLLSTISRWGPNFVSP